MAQGPATRDYENGRRCTGVGLDSFATLEIEETPVAMLYGG